MKKYFLLLWIICCLTAVCMAQKGGEYTFDYDRCATHPRLLMTKGAERSIMKSLKSSVERQFLYDVIMHTSDSLLACSPVRYEKTGIRLLGVSRETLLRVFYLSFSYRTTGKLVYADRVKEELRAVCAFPDWNPSHFLDVGEMATAVAIGYDWIYDELSADDRKRVEKALLEKALLPSFDERYGWFLQTYNNWNQVCNAGLVFAALALIDTNRDLAVKTIERAMSGIDNSMTEYAPNGNYAEGYNYWAYGTTYNMMMIAALESALGSDGGLCGYPGFLESAKYIQYMTGVTGKPFNYSDNREDVQFIPAMPWFAEKTNNPSLLWNEYVPLRKKEIGFSKRGDIENERFLPLALVYGGKFAERSIVPPTDKVWVGHGRTPVALFRTAWTDGVGLYLGLKGGRASTSHGHMDGGSFVFEALGVRWAEDMEMERYSRLEAHKVDLWNGAQDGQRWDIFRYNNFVHNTLTINGRKHVSDAYLPIVDVVENDSVLGATVDMKPVFVPLVEEAKRQFRIYDEVYLEISDSLVAAESEELTVRWTMVTSTVPTRLDDRMIELAKDGRKLRVVVVQPADASFQILNNQPEHEYDSPNPNSVRLVFDSKIPAGHDGKIVVNLLPQY